MIAAVDPLPHIPRADEPMDTVWVICSREGAEHPAPIWWTRESPRGHVLDGGTVHRVEWPEWLRLSVTTEADGSTVFNLPASTPMRVAPHPETGEDTLFIGERR